MKYAHIVWDWNGTLLDDAWLSVEVLNAMLAKRSLPTLAKAAYLGMFDFPVINFYERIGFDFKKESFEKVGVEFIDAYNSRRAECLLRSGAADFISGAKASGLTHSILSAYEKNYLADSVKNCGIDAHFIKISGLEDIFAGGKAELGRRHVEALKINKKSMVMVGDTSHDFEVAKGVGIDCVLFAGGHQDIVKLSKLGAPVAQNFEDLLNILK